VPQSLASVSIVEQKEAYEVAPSRNELLELGHAHDGQRWYDCRQEKLTAVASDLVGRFISLFTLQWKRIMFIVCRTSTPVSSRTRVVLFRAHYARIGTAARLCDFLG
jgi:hypothetical protein